MLFIDTIKTYFKSVILLGLIAVLGNPLESSATSLNEELASSSAPAAGSVAGRKLEEAFYIFDVGQGNSQLAIYFDQLGKPFGILYDCGSSAQTVNSKFLQLRSKSTIDELMVFFSKKREKTEVSAGEFDFGSSEEEESPIKKKGRASIDSTGSATSTTSTNTTTSVMSGGAAKVRPETSVSEQIKTALGQLQDLFVVLSHPDRDHINLLKESVPEKLNVLFILSGDFFRESDGDDKKEAEKADDKLKTDVKNLFQFIAARKKRASLKEETEEISAKKTGTIKKAGRRSAAAKKSAGISVGTELGETHVTLPYFWTSTSTSEYYPLEYQKVLKVILTNKEGEGAEEKSQLSNAIKRHTPDFFQGNFKEFLQKVQSMQPQATQALTFYEKYLEGELLSNIYIWAMNHVSDDINNHSLVMSFCMPSLQKAFICTGDAGHEVFQRIEQHIRDKKLLSNDASSSPDASSSVAPPQLKVSEKVNKFLYNGQSSNHYTVLLMLPHHGSRGNESVTMLDLFRPHILGISAGAGSLYNHPSEELIKNYQELYRGNEHLEDRKKEVWKRYALKGPSYHYMTFKSIRADQKGKTITEPRLKTVDPEKDLPILSPNVVGTIRITKDQFFMEHSSFFELNGSFYHIDLKSSSFEVEGSSRIKKEEIMVDLSKSDKVKMGSEVVKIKVKQKDKGEIVFQKTEDDPNIFLSEDHKKILLALDIPYQEGTLTELRRKYYLGIEFNLD